MNEAGIWTGVTGESHDGDLVVHAHRIPNRDIEAVVLRVLAEEKSDDPCETCSHVQPSEIETIIRMVLAAEKDTPARPRDIPHGHCECCGRALIWGPLGEAIEKALEAK